MKTPLSLLLDNKGRSIYSVSANETAYNCALKMKQFNIGILLVVDGEKLQGIVSERDIVRKAVSLQHDPTTTLATEIMTAKVITASPKTTVQEAMQIITEH